MKILSEYSIFRLRRVLSIVAGVFAITLYAHGSIERFTDSENLIKFFMGDGALFLLLCAAYLMNDLLDFVYDSINRPNAVYIDRLISRRTIIFIIILLIVAGVALSSIVNKYFFIIILTQLTSVIFYNFFSKQLSFFKPVLISLLVISVYPLSVALAGGGVPSPRFDALYPLTIWLFFTTLAFEILYDVKDSEGDSAPTGRGYVKTLGENRTIIIGKAFALGAIIPACIPFAMQQCGVIYLAGSILSVLPIVLSIISGKGDLPKLVHFSMVGVILSSVVDLLVYA